MLLKYWTFLIFLSIKSWQVIKKCISRNIRHSRKHECILNLATDLQKTCFEFFMILYYLTTYQCIWLFILHTIANWKVSHILIRRNSSGHINEYFTSKWGQVCLKLLFTRIRVLQLNNTVFRAFYSFGIGTNNFKFNSDKDQSFVLKING